MQSKANNKPKIGQLYYNNRPIGEPAPFWKIGALRKSLVQSGYDNKLFSQHYHYGNN